MTGPRSVKGYEHHRFGYALWYAWGRLDADPSLQAAGVDANAFALAQGEAAIAADAGHKTFLPSIQDAWRAYIADSDQSQSPTERETEQ